MTTLEVIAILMTPVAGLIIAGAMMLIVRRDDPRRSHRHAGE